MSEERELDDYDAEFFKYLKAAPLGRSMGDVVAFFIDPQEARERVERYVAAGIARWTDQRTLVLTPAGKDWLSSR
ncbi:MAG: hypothetical protein Kow0069_09760 [Promethearchaeota archaeon]